MAEKLSSEQLAEIRQRVYLHAKHRGVSTSELVYADRADLAAHISALEEELKAARDEREHVKDWRNNLHDYLMSEDAVVKKAVNNFRAKLIEVIRTNYQLSAKPLQKFTTDAIIELIESFEATNE